MGQIAHLKVTKTMNINTLQITALLILTTCFSCKGPTDGFTDAELELINGTDSIMRVLTVEDEADLAVLRNSSSDLSLEALQSDEYDKLASLMLATVNHPSQNGVGIAAPQVGINRRIVAVQRFDKEPVKISRTENPVRTDYPFEVYPNIRIVWKSDSLALGPEGCLSVPGRRGEVLRSQEIVIEYADMAAVRSNAQETGSGNIPMIRDTVHGFTAVIFQHETDHLDGTLYTDHLK